MIRLVAQSHLVNLILESDSLDDVGPLGAIAARNNNFCRFEQLLDDSLELLLCIHNNALHKYLGKLSPAHRDAARRMLNIVHRVVAFDGLF